jgi:hypothetical protein
MGVVHLAHLEVEVVAVAAAREARQHPRRDVLPGWRLIWDMWPMMI